MHWVLWSAQDGGPVNAEKGKPYQGVKLTLDEDKLRSLLQHSTRSGLSLNSRCMLLWINVASFCVSLLTGDCVTLSGILASTEPMEEYCVSQLRYLWNFMKINMQLTDEELSYLMMMCMRRNLQVCRNVLLIQNVNTCFTFVWCITGLGGIPRQNEWDLHKCRNGCRIWAVLAQ